MQLSMMTISIRNYLIFMCAIVLYFIVLYFTILCWSISLWLPYSKTKRIVLNFNMESVFSVHVIIRNHTDAKAA